jgi:uncharacterized protein
MFADELKVKKKKTDPTRKARAPTYLCGMPRSPAQTAMVRIVRTVEGVRVDPTGKLAGRGAYLHDRRECWTRGLKGALAHALKTELNADDRAELENL